MEPSASPHFARRLGLPVLRRRGWLLLACAVGVAAIAQGLGSMSSASYTGQALLMVPSGANHRGPGAGNDATKLAATYAVVMSNDDALVASAARAVRTSASDLSKHLTVLNDTDTGLIRVRYEAASERSAIDGASTVARLVTASSESRLYPAGSIRIVALPTPATITTSGGKSSLLIPIGVILGLLLGGVLMIAWERNDPRIDDVDGLAGECGAPATELRQLRPAAAGALLRRWHELSDTLTPVIALLPASDGRDDLTAAAAHYLVQQARAAGVEVVEGNGQMDVPDDGVVTITTGGRPGGLHAGEAVAQNADLAVVLASADSRVADVRQAITSLERFGVACSWALLVPRRASDLREHADARTVNGVVSGQPEKVQVGDYE